MEIFGNLIWAIAVVVGLSLLAYIVDIVRYKNSIAEQDRMSFRESMDLVNLPIITFINNGKKLNFLLDTGASYSVINEAALEGMKYEETGEGGTYTGIEGITKEGVYVKINVGYKTQVYQDDFQVADMNEVFGQVKQESGINLHGLIGSSFFQKYKYILDFKELVAYSKV